jgi:flavin-dependent dehydrogenase
MTTRSRCNDVDVVIIGGGPAGATAGALLASWGRSVVIVHAGSAAPSLAESLPVSARKLFQFLGLAELVDAAGFHPNRGNLSHWAGKETLARTDGDGFHVPRARFDRLLRDHALARGAVVVEGHARNIEVSGTVTVARSGSSERQSYRGRYVLDCTGRAGVIASRGLRRPVAGCRTLAVTAEWECARWLEDERTYAIVESYRDGWAWSVPLSPMRRQCTVMIDADGTTVRKAGLSSLYDRELQKAVAIRKRLVNARQVGRPWACDASVYDCVKAFDGCALLVGDAASFIEPLSSGGVKKALSSSWRAAVVVNTCLDKPEMQSPAFEFYDRRERQVWAGYQRHTESFFRAAGGAHDDQFWSTRAAALASVPGGADGDLSDADLGREPGVSSAFERLRRTRVGVLKPKAMVSFAKTGVIEGRRIIMREAVVVPGTDTPIRFAAGVNLPEVLRISAGGLDVSSLIEIYQRRVGGISPRNLLAGVSFLISRGLLDFSSDAHAHRHSGED